MEVDLSLRPSSNPASIRPPEQEEESKAITIKRLEEMVSNQQLICAAVALTGIGLNQPESHLHRFSCCPRCAARILGQKVFSLFSHSERDILSIISSVMDARSIFPIQLSPSHSISLADLPCQPLFSGKCGTLDPISFGWG